MKPLRFALLAPFAKGGVSLETPEKRQSPDISDLPTYPEMRERVPNGLAEEKAPGRLPV